MARSNEFRLQGNAAEAYERQKVPAMFRPLAQATLEVVAPRSNDHIVDIACGTGIVARLAASLIAHTEMSIPRRFGPAANSIPQEIAGMAYADAVKAAGAEVETEIVRRVAAALAPYAQGEGFEIPRMTNLFQATAP